MTRLPPPSRPLDPREQPARLVDGTWPDPGWFDELRARVRAGPAS